MAEDFSLERFLSAQATVYPQVVAELRTGRKQSHWMWFVFPQLRGLGHSPMAHRYGIASREEAAAYLAHPVLGARLRECVALCLAHVDSPADRIFGYPDTMKFRSCLTLFAAVDDPGGVFSQALEGFFEGKADSRTLGMLT